MILGPFKTDFVNIIYFDSKQTLHDALSVLSPLPRRARPSRQLNSGSKQQGNFSSLNLAAYMNSFHTVLSKKWPLSKMYWQFMSFYRKLKAPFFRLKMVCEELRKAPERLWLMWRLDFALKPVNFDALLSCRLVLKRQLRHDCYWICQDKSRSVHFLDLPQ